MHAKLEKLCSSLKQMDDKPEEQGHFLRKMECI